jgi:hypothetical protein
LHETACDDQPLTPKFVPRANCGDGQDDKQKEYAPPHATLDRPKSIAWNGAPFQSWRAPAFGSEALILLGRKIRVKPVFNTSQRSFIEFRSIRIE